MEQGKESVTNTQENVKQVSSNEIETVAGKIMEGALTLSDSTQSENTSTANKHSTEIEENRVATGKTVEITVETEKDWSNVSPGKAGRVPEKKQDSETVISPSRFQLMRKRMIKSSFMRARVNKHASLMILKRVRYCFLKVENNFLLWKDRLSERGETHTLSVCCYHKGLKAEWY